MIIQPANIEWPERVSNINTENRVKAVPERDSGGAGYYGTGSRINPAKVTTAGTENNTEKESDNSSLNSRNAFPFKSLFERLLQTVRPMSANEVTITDSGSYRKVKNSATSSSSPVSGGSGFILTVAPSNSSTDTEGTEAAAFTDMEMRIQKSFYPERFINTGRFVNITA